MINTVISLSGAHPSCLEGIHLDKLLAHAASGTSWTHFYFIFVSFTFLLLAKKKLLIFVLNLIQLIDHFM